MDLLQYFIDEEPILQMPIDKLLMAQTARSAKGAEAFMRILNPPESPP